MNWNEWKSEDPPRISRVWLPVAVAGWAMAIGIFFVALNAVQPPRQAPIPPNQPLAVEIREKAVATYVVQKNDEPPPGVGFGWKNDPEAVAAVICEMGPVRVFGDTPAGQDQPLPEEVYLWKAYEGLFNKPVPEKDQNPTGSCVGFGTTTAIERSLAVEVANRALHGMGDASEFTLFSEEVTYAGSRVEANGGRSPIPARSDGSNGSWAAKFATKFGMAPKAKYTSADLTEYSASRARSWNNTGVPDDIELECAKYKVADAVRIVRWADAKKALANGYGIAVCSDIGYNRQRDANGVAREGPAWAHCMCLDGYHIEPNGKEYGHIENSWAKTNYHTGPVGWGNPTNAGFWAESAVIERMLAEGDSWAYSGVKGFPRQDLDWFAKLPQPRTVPVKLEDGLCDRSLLSLAW